MIILACDTSSLIGSVAISENENILASKALERAGSHSDTLNNMIHECLKEAGKSLADIDAFAAGIGPGSFTGIRIGLNTIKTYSYVYNKPCYGLNSLFLMADYAASKGHKNITTILNAYKNMLYFAEYKSDGLKIIEVQPPQVVRVQEFSKYLNLESVVVGEGYVAYQQYLDEKFNNKIKRNKDLLDTPLSDQICKNVFSNPNSKIHWSELLPLYLRASEAEENLQGIKYQSL